MAATQNDDLLEEHQRLWRLERGAGRNETCHLKSQQSDPHDGYIHRLTEEQIAVIAPEVAEKPLAYFEERVRRAAAKAADQCEEEGELVSPLVLSAKNAGLPKQITEGTYGWGTD